MIAFGRSKREQTCDCEPVGHPSLRQALQLMSDPKLLADIEQGSLNQLIDQESDDRLIIRELFLRTLSRFPTDAEVAQVLEFHDRKMNRSPSMEIQSWAAVLWSLLNTQEFLTIH